MAAAEWRHRRTAREIAHRVLICGMRGKSTAVRLLHAGFSGGNRIPLSRLTGDEAVHLMPDGMERGARRWGSPNIREMRRTVRRAARMGCEALFLENMAIDPVLSRLASTHIAMPTMILHCVDGPDHGEHYPFGRARRGELVMSTWPRNVPVVVAASERNRGIIDAARNQGRDLVVAGSAGDDGLRPYMRSIAGAVECVLERCLGGAVDTEKIRGEARKLQALTVYRLGEQPVVDLLSANDPESTEEMLEALHSEGKLAGEFRMVFFHRADRPGRFLAFEPLLQKYDGAVAGDVLPLTYRRRTRAVAPARLDAVLRESPCPVILAGNRHSPVRGRLEKILSQAAVEKW